jgi:hypothetical protein
MSELEDTECGCLMKDCKKCFPKEESFLQYLKDIYGKRENES